MSNTDRTDPPTPDELPPGPYSVEWPDEQGGLFTVWGRQGTPPDFADGWAIPLVAKGMQSVMEWLADHLNRGASWSTSTPIATATGSAAGGATSPTTTTTDAALPSAPDQRPAPVVCVGHCGSLDWTLSEYGVITHKHTCPRRTTTFCQSHRDGCPAALSEATPSPEATLDVALLMQHAEHKIGCVICGSPTSLDRLAEIVVDSLAAATEGTDYAEAPEPSDEPGSPYVLRLTNEIAARLRGPA